MSKRERSLQNSTLPLRKKTPSFSSSLLDSIYSSTDESTTQHRRDSAFSTNSTATTKKHSHRGTTKHDHSLKRAIMIEEWIEKQNPASASYSRSSDSGAGAGFTKSTKLRALKIYSELKKVKQPISPGGRISTFLNSIFNSGNVKKAKMCYVGAVDDVTFKSKSKSCSSASSFSRSCMTKPAEDSSRSRIKRSVRFYPVSVIVGEDSRPCGHKPVHYNDEVGKNTSMAVNKNTNYTEFCVEDEDTDSCTSSDLFELDHLIGIGRYREELPVYETTCLKKNHAIANSSKL